METEDQKPEQEYANPWVIRLGCGGLLIFFIFFVCFINWPRTGYNPVRESKNVYKITYRVEGVGEGTVTYLNQNGDLEQHTDVDFLSWEKNWTGRPGEKFEFTAHGRKPYPLELQILVDGKVKQSTKVTGKFASGSVSYECCD